MTEANSTRDRLLAVAQREFWTRGYSNVSLREIARAVGVDVALASRYFGSKMGLFEATLDRAFDAVRLPDDSAEALVDHVVEIFVTTPRDGEAPSVVRMILMNAHDRDVGALVRARHADGLQAQLEQVIGDRARAALFMAVCLGIGVAEKSLRLTGIAPVGTPAYEAQLRHLLAAALDYGG